VWCPRGTAWRPHVASPPALTTEPHDERHLGRDPVVAEEIQQVGEREDVDRSAEQHEHLLTTRSRLRQSSCFCTGACDI
jgi:hypothetical protein